MSDEERKGNGDFARRPWEKRIAEQERMLALKVGSGGIYKAGGS